MAETEAKHVAVAYAVQNFSLAEALDGGPPPALAIQMSPLVIAPAVQEEALVPDTVTPDQAEPVEETETVAEVKPVIEPAPEPGTEEAEPVTEAPVQVRSAIDVPLWTMFESYVIPRCAGAASSRAFGAGSMVCG